MCAILVWFCAVFSSRFCPRGWAERSPEWAPQRGRKILSCPGENLESGGEPGHLVALWVLVLPLAIFPKKKTAPAAENSGWWRRKQKRRRERETRTQGSTGQCQQELGGCAVSHASGALAGTFPLFRFCFGTGSPGLF